MPTYVHMFAHSRIARYVYGRAEVNGWSMRWNIEAVPVPHLIIRPDTVPSVDNRRLSRRPRSSCMAQKSIGSLASVPKLSSSARSAVTLNGICRAFSATLRNIWRILRFMHIGRKPTRHTQRLLLDLLDVPNVGVAVFLTMDNRGLDRGQQRRPKHTYQGQLRWQRTITDHGQHLARA